MPSAANVSFAPEYAPPVLHSVSCPSGGGCFAVGSDQGGNAVIWHATSEDPTNADWTQQAEVVAVRQSAFDSISCADALHCFAVSTPILDASAVDLLETTDDGATWLPVGTVTDRYSINGATELGCPTTTDCFIGIDGDSYGSAGALFWELTPSVTANEWAVTSINRYLLSGGWQLTTSGKASCLPGACFFATSGGAVGGLVEVTPGSAPAEVTLSPATGVVGGIDGVACNEATDSCYVTATITNYPNGSYDGVFASSGGGQTWSFHTFVGTGASAIGASSAAAADCPSASDCVLVARSGEYYSTDGAVSWTVANDNGSPTAPQVSCVDTTTCFAEATATSIVPTYAMTTDGGQTWSGWSAVPSTSPATGVALQAGSLTCSWDVACFFATRSRSYAQPYEGSAIVDSTTGIAAPIGGALSLAELFGGRNIFEACSACALGSLGLQDLVSDPVNTATGQLSESYGDVSVPSAGLPLAFSRTYDSNLAQAEAESGQPGPLGYGWTDNLATSLAVDPTSGDATVTGPTGAEVFFVPPSGGSCPAGDLPSSGLQAGELCAAPRVQATLTEQGDGSYVLDQHDGTTWSFSAMSDASGNHDLTAIRDSTGNSEALAWLTPGEAGPHAIDPSCPSSGVSSCEDIDETPAGETAPVSAMQVGYSVLGTHTFVTSVTDPLSRTWTYAYCSPPSTSCSDGDLVSVTAPALVEGGTTVPEMTSYGYDAGNANESLTHDLVSITGPNAQPGGPDAGDAATFTYDGAGRVAEEKDPAGRETLFSFRGNAMSALGGATTVTDPHGNETFDSYAYGELLAQTTAAGTSDAQSTWDERDPATLLPVAVVGPHGEVSQMAYDAAGDLTSSTDPDQNTTTYTGYNALGEVGIVTPPSPLAATSYSYLSDGRVHTATQGARTTTYTYCSPSSSCPSTALVAQVSDPAGHVTSYNYTSMGEVASVSTYPSGSRTNTTEYGYDADGELTCTASPNAVAGGLSCPSSDPTGLTTYHYYSNGELESSTDRLGNTTSYSYDADGNAVSVTSPGTSAPTTTTTLYDADDRPISVTAGAGTAAAATTTYGYDLPPGTGGCPSTDGVTYCTTTEAPDQQGSSSPVVSLQGFDAAGRLVTDVPPSGDASSDAYDESPGTGSCPVAALYCDVSTVPASSGPSVATTLAYDPAGLLLSSIPSDGTPAATYTYDADGNEETSTTSQVEKSYAYDEYGEPSSVTTTPIGASASTVSYGYDLDGERTCLSYPTASVGCPQSGGTPPTGVVEYSFDNAGEMSSLTDWQGNTTDFAYDHDGNLTGTTYPNGDAVDSTYFADDTMSTSSVTGSGSGLPGISYNRYPDGQVESEIDTGLIAPNGSGPFTLSDTYNARDNLTASSPTTFGYDLNGNPTTFGASAQSFNSSDQLYQSTTGYLETQYGYNAAGQRTSLSAQTTALTPYGAASPITIGSSASYAWDANGNLSSVTASQSLTGRMAVSAEFGLFVQPDGSVMAAGANAAGELGNGTTTSSTTPVAVEATPSCPQTGVVAVSAGGYFGMELEGNGTICTFGSDNYGQLGINSITDSDVPEAVSTDNNGEPLPPMVAVAAGQYFALSLGENGQVYAWGQNNDGQLGDGTTTERKRPVEVAGRSDCSAVAAGEFFALALCGGEVYAWGDNTYGQSGAVNVGGTVLSPTTIDAASGGCAGSASGSPLTGVTEIAAGNYSALALGAGGAVCSWGWNNYGQLGIGEYVSGLADSPTAVPVEGLPAGGAVSISDGSANDSFVLGVNGDVYAFGSNGKDDWGSGSTAAKSDVPVLVGTGASEIETGGASAVEAFPSGQVVAFGDNTNGQLGIGASTTTVPLPEPVQGVSSAGSTIYSASYVSDGDGLRQSETSAGITSEFTWDTTSSVPVLLSDADTTGTFGNYYVYGPNGVPVEQIGVSSGTVSYYVSDQLGSTRALLSSAGKVVAAYGYGAYGALSSSWGTASTPILFASGYLDGATGLYYFISRNYDPTTGQFVSRDPLVALTGEPYTYAGGDPVSLIDRSGLIEGLPGEGGGPGSPSELGGPPPSYGGALWEDEACETYTCADEPVQSGPGAGVDLQDEIQAAEQARCAFEQRSMDAAEGGTSLDQLAASGTELDPADAGGQLTRAGRAFAKASEVFGSTSGGPAAINEAGQNALEEILTNPGTTESVMRGGNFAGGLRFVAPDGIGAVFSPDGTFQYFGRMSP